MAVLAERVKLGTDKLTHLLGLPSSTGCRPAVMTTGLTIVPVPATIHVRKFEKVWWY